MLERWGISLLDLPPDEERKGEMEAEQTKILGRLEYLRGVINASLIHAEHVEKRIES